MGDDLPCGAAYPGGTPIETWLVRSIDTTELAGIEVQLRYWTDQPAGRFQVCATTGVKEEPYECVRPDAVPGEWSSPAEPLVFAAAAGRPTTDLVIVYRDPDPTGRHVGLFIDNVVIDGLPH